MGGGGSKTTNVTNQTGLGDAQYANLQTGQSAILDANANYYNDLAARSDVGQQANASYYTDLAARSDAERAETNAGFSNLTGLGNQNLAATQGVSAQVNDVGTAVNTGFNSLGTQVGTGFNTLGTQVDTRANQLSGQVGEGFARTQDSLTSGFANQAADTRQGFADTQGAIRTGFDATNANLNTRFDAQGNAIQTGFADTSNRLDTMQTNVLGGQAGIRTLVEQYGGNLDRYYADLARGQDDASQRLGGLQTNLTAFQKDQQRDNTIATQQRAQLSDSVAGGFNAVRDTISAESDTQARALGGQATAITTQMAQQDQNMQKNFSQVARELSQGFQSNTAQGEQSRNEFINSLTTIRGLLSDQNVQVDQAIRQQYQDLSSAFDDTGKLISRSVDQTGIQTARAIDSQGRLLLARFNQNGERVDQQALDMNKMLNTVAAGGLTQASAPVQPTGLMTPYAVTR